MAGIQGLNVTGDYKREGPVQTQDLNSKAKSDLRYAINESGMSCLEKVGHLLVSGTRTVADIVVYGADEHTSKVEVPKTELTEPTLGKVGVVVYKGGNVAGIYLFTYEEIQKTGLFSRFKYDSKNETYVIKMAGIEKCEQNRFAVVLREHIKH